MSRKGKVQCGRFGVRWCEYSCRCLICRMERSDEEDEMSIAASPISRSRHWVRLDEGQNVILKRRAKTLFVAYRFACWPMTKSHDFLMSARLVRYVWKTMKSKARCERSRAFMSFTKSALTCG